MKTKIELTAMEIAGLDLMIASKISSEGFMHAATYTDDTVVEIIVAVPAVVTDLVGDNADIVAVGAVKSHPDPTGKKGLEIAKNASLEHLLKIRYSAILKQ